MISLEKKKIYRDRWNTKHRQKKLAHKHVNRAVASGKLSREPCEVCGKPDGIHGHHDDYSKPLEVRWLCRKHHDEWHRNNPPVAYEQLEPDSNLNRKLNTEAVKVIKYALKYMNFTQWRLGELHGVTKGTISQIHQGLIWKDVKI